MNVVVEFHPFVAEGVCLGQGVAIEVVFVFGEGDLDVIPEDEVPPPPPPPVAPAHLIEACDAIRTVESFVNEFSRTQSDRTFEVSWVHRIGFMIHLDVYDHIQKKNVAFFSE